MSARTPVGEQGQVWLRPIDAQGNVLDRAVRGCRWRAFVKVRDRDGRRRIVQGTGKTQGAAERALERKLKARRPAGWLGVDANMTVRELGEYWMEQRKQGSAVPEKGQRRGGPLAPQSLLPYRYALDSDIYPAIGDLRLHEVTTGIIDSVLLDMERHKRSTRQVRTVLIQAFRLAVRHQAMSYNPMADVDKPRRVAKEVEALSVEQARDFLELVHDYCTAVKLDSQGRKMGGKRRSVDLYEIVLLMLATGCRIGEVLALRWRDIENLATNNPTVHVRATLIEPKKVPDRKDKHGNVIAKGEVFVPTLTYQPTTKGRERRTLFLPDAAAAMLMERRKRTQWRRLDDPIFASKNGTHLWPNNVRTTLRRALADTVFVGTTPHALRRTVGTLLAHEAGLDVARDVLGHSDPSITFQAYVGTRPTAPDVRNLLDLFFNEHPIDAMDMDPAVAAMAE